MAVVHATDLVTTSTPTAADTTADTAINTLVDRVIEEARHRHQQLGFVVRVWRATVAGRSTGPLRYELHSHGIADHLARMELLGPDPATWWVPGPGAPAPLAPASASLYSSEAGLPWPPIAPPGPVPRALLSTLYAPLTPDQRASFVPALTEAFGLVARTGAMLRVSEALVAGELTGAVAADIEAPSVAVLGAAIEALRADATYRALGLRVRAGTHPPRQAHRALYVEVV